MEKLWLRIIALISGIIVLILSQVTVQKSYNLEVIIDDDHFRFYSYADQITYKSSLSAGDRLEINLRVTSEDVIFYIMDGYGSEWMKRRTTGFVEYWNVSKTGDFFITLENPHLIYIYPTGYLTVTNHLATPKYETDYLFGVMGVLGLLFLGALLLTVSIFLPLLDFHLESKRQAR